ncbi:MAG: hypothetical protein H6684_13510 [Deltaproteobacteria bacterium]|nr:hypothetical protein [Deltaproteobacteria bacterium]
MSATSDVQNSETAPPPAPNGASSAHPTAQSSAKAPKCATLPPLQLDPRWYNHVRPLMRGDVTTVAELHAKGMGTTLWGSFGRHFLEALYRAMLDDPDFVAFVFEENRIVRGFIVGSTDGSNMMKRTFRKAFWKLLPHVVKAGYRDPALIREALATPRYFAKSATDSRARDAAESFFCYIQEEWRGTRISGLMNKFLFDELLFRGFQRVKITTEADNDGALRQLDSWGFEPVGEFEFYAKKMTTHLLELHICSRVQPVRRHIIKDTEQVQRLGSG